MQHYTAPWRSNYTAPWRSNYTAPWRSNYTAPWRSNHTAPWRSNHSAPWRRISLITAVAALGLATAITPAQAAAPDVVRWASPTGSGSACSATAPCALDTALAQTRAATASMAGDLVVRLAAGTYRRAAPITLTAADSGRNGYRVRIEAASGAAVTVSGGRVVTGWTRTDRTRDIWRAAVPRGFASRQLFVNGVRASLASAPAASVLGTMTTTATGYTISSRSLSAFPNVTDTELVWPAGGTPGPGEQALMAWSHTACGVASATATTVTVDSACWGNARRSLTLPDGSKVAAVTQPTTVQNNYALLDAPGEFYLDSAAGYLYYKPRSGESLSTATVEMPQVTRLIEATDVQNLTVQGLTFEDTTWVPNTSIGVFAIQANVVAATANVNPYTISTIGVIPSALTFTRARGLQLERLTVRATGGGGISLSGGGSNNRVRGCVVTDVGANGIAIGEGRSMTAADSYETDTTIEGNVVRRIGVDYPSAVGIFATWTRRLTIRDNDITDTPYTGISLGWGWMNTSSAGDNHIIGNRIARVMQSRLNDGGGIYLLGRQTPEVMSTVIDNHVSGVPKDYGAIYLDSGASSYLVTGNVVEQAPRGWVYLQNIATGGVAWNNLVAGNWADTTTQQLAPRGTHPDNYVADNDLGLTTWPEAAAAVVGSAGVKGDYLALR